MDVRALLVDVLSGVGLVLFMFVLSPQIYLNYRTASTEGLSRAMLVLFLLGALTPGIYYLYSDQPVALTAAWLGFSVLDVIVLAQMWYYAEERREWGDSRRKKGVAVQLLLYLAGSLLLCALTWLLFYLTGDSANSLVTSVPTIFGYLLPAGLTTLGYLVQIRLIVREKSAAGVSPGFILMDLVGCSSSIAAIALNDFDGAAVAPLAGIIVCQLVMGLLYFVIYPPRQQAETGALLAGKQREDATQTPFARLEGEE